MFTSGILECLGEELQCHSSRFGLRGGDHWFPLTVQALQALAPYLSRTLHSGRRRVSSWMKGSAHWSKLDMLDIRPTTLPIRRLRVTVQRKTLPVPVSIAWVCRRRAVWCLTTASGGCGGRGIWEWQCEERRSTVAGRPALSTLCCVRLSVSSPRGFGSLEGLGGYHTFWYRLGRRQDPQRRSLASPQTRAGMMVAMNSSQPDRDGPWTLASHATGHG